MAAIPFAMLTLGVLGYLLQHRVATGGEFEFVLGMLLPAPERFASTPFDGAERMIATVVEGRAQLSRYGIPLFLLFSTRLFRSTRIALDAILGTESHRRWFIGVARDVSLVVLTTALFTSSAIARIPGFRDSWLELLLGNLLSVLFSAVLFYVVYAIAPARRLRRETAVIAAVISAFAFEAAKVVFGIYVAEFATINQAISHQNAIAVLLFVAWIYYTATIFLLGGEFAKAYEGISPQPA